MVSNSKWTAPVSLLSLKENAGVKLQLHSKQSSKGPSSEYLMATSGCFKCNTYHIMVLGWLKKDQGGGGGRKGEEGSGRGGGGEGKKRRRRRKKN